MPFKSKRSQSMMGKTNAKKSKQVHGEPSPDEAPALATKRLPVVHTVDEHSAAERKEIWGVVLNPIAPLALPKPQDFMYQNPLVVPIAAATEASSSAADANAGNTSASDAAAGPA